MSAIYKREFRSYFSSPIGYVFVAILLFFEGFQFFSVLPYQSTDNVVAIYSFIFTFGMMLIPILTMKLLSEEKRQKTDQALLTAPISLAGIVLGKFFAAFTVYGIAILATILHAFVWSFFGSMNWAIVFGNILGTLLYGGAMIAIGVFISGLTDSQMIAAVGTFGASVFLLLVESLKAAVPYEWASKLISWFSFSSRYTPFTWGIFNFANVIYFISVAGVFLYLSIATLEKRRWS